MKKLIYVILMIMVSNLSFASEDSLIHYFSFDNHTTDLISLESSVQTGNVSYTESVGGCGTALQLDGDSHLEFDMEGLEEWTIAFWINIDQLPSRGMHLVGKKADIFEGDAGNYNFASGVSPTGQFNFQYESRGSNIDYRVSYVSITPQIWYHIIAVKKTDGTQSIYVNGVLAVKAIFNAIPCANNMPLIIGGRIVENANNLEGSIDEIKIYSTGDDNEEFISDIYNASEGLACNPTVVEIEKIVEIEVPVESSELLSSLNTLMLENSALRDSLNSNVESNNVEDIAIELQLLRTELLEEQDKYASSLIEIDELKTKLNKSESIETGEEKIVIVEVPVEIIKEVIKEVPVEIIKEVIKEVPVEIIKEISIPFSQKTDYELTVDFFSIVKEHGERKENGRGENFNGNYIDDINDNGNHYGNDTPDNNGNDVNNAHNTK